MARTWLAAGVAAAILMTGVLVPRAVGADSRPLDPANAATPTTVTADVLPTVQINGVAWAQVVSGNTVFVGGSFTNARPAGAAAGTNQTRRSNFLAYDIRTGELITSFAPSFNAQVRSIAVSSDGSRLYVAGDFTSVDGLRRDRLAAFDLASGRLVGTFLPPMGFNVHAVALSPDDATLYVGGDFAVVGSQTRNRLAAFRASDAALLSWAPNAQGGLVAALVVSPDGTKVAIGGKFTTLNGSSTPGRGLGAVNAVTGAKVPWAIGALIRNAGNNAGITSLSSDGTAVYGTAFSFEGGGNFEGVFSALWDGGTIDWVADCHGDHYSAHSRDGEVYVVGHAHTCANVPGGFPETNPRSFNRALAFGKARTGTLLRNTVSGYYNFEGQPSPSPLLWYPNFNAGTFTGQGQGPWHVTGNGQYVVMGGEFTTVNARAQQGLVRFAVAEAAPNREGPRLYGNTWATTVATSTFAGAVRLAWTANWDRDNENLTYFVERNGVRVGSVTAASSFYNRPSVGFLDTGATSGVNATYRIIAVDPFGNEAPSNPVTIRVSSAGVRSAYTDAMLGTGGLVDYWRLGETANSFADVVGTRPLSPSGGMTSGVTGAIPGDIDRAVTFVGGNAATGSTGATPQTFSIEAWFRSTSTSGGKIIGSENRPGQFQPATPDRHLYLDDDGRVYFGVFAGASQSISSTSALNDGIWHHVVGTVGTGTMRLYVDGDEVAARTGVGTQRAYNGDWKVGGGTLTGWSPRPSSDFLAGTVDEAAVYNAVLSADDVRLHYVVGTTGSTPNRAPNASFTPSAVETAVYVDGSPSTDPDGSITAWAWDFGDGSTAEGRSLVHAFAAAGTYTVQLTVTDDDGAAASTTRTVTVGAPAPGPIGFVRDGFERTVTGGFGTAEMGGPWTISGPTGLFAVGGGRASMTLATPGAGMSAAIAAASTDTELRASFSSDKAATGNGVFVSLVGRRVGTSDYRAKIRVRPSGAVDAWLTTAVGGTEPTLATGVLAGLSAAPGEPLQARFQVVGTNPTALRLKVWKLGQAEPSGWQLATTDSTTGLQVGGGVGLVTFLSGSAKNAPVTISFDDVWAGATAVPGNELPVPAFTAMPTNLTTTFDASGSSDPDGSIAAYAWDFGDGQAGTGVSLEHTYAAGGTYTVTLTVTDDDLATATLSHDVSVSPPVEPTPFATDAFERVVAGGLGAADVGGAWTLAGPATSFAVDAGLGRVTIPNPGNTTAASLGVVSTDTELRASIGADKAASGGSIFISVIGRRVGTADYRAKLRMTASGTVDATLTRTAGGTETAIAAAAIPGIGVAPGELLQVRFQVTGTDPTTLRFKVWKTGEPEPAGWLLTATDATSALQAGGGIGVLGYLGGASTNAPLTVLIDDLWAGPSPV